MESDLNVNPIIYGNSGGKAMNNTQLRLRVDLLEKQVANWKSDYNKQRDFYERKLDELSTKASWATVVAILLTTYSVFTTLTILKS